MEPLVRVDGDGQPVGCIQDGDYVIFYDIRGEREIELTSAFVDADFPHFPRPPMTVSFATMIEYHPDLDVQVAFPPLGQLEDTLFEMVSQAACARPRSSSRRRRSTSASFSTARPGCLSRRGAGDHPFPAAGYPLRDATAR